MTTQQFKIGFYQIHPDVSLNYEMNRFSDGSEESLNEIREVAPRIHNYADYIREFLALSEKAHSANRLLPAALYLRAAEFFMFPKDERKTPSRKSFIRWMKECYRVQESQHFNIPYENAMMNAYRFQPESPIGTVVFLPGFDGYTEELFPHAQYFLQNGFDAIIFDGPGQGTTLEEGHLTMTNEWHKPCKAVLDYFKLNDVTLIGCSLGGCLALRAAAFEPRISRVVCYDILTDFQQVLLKQLDPLARGALSTLLKLGASSTVNALIHQKMKRSLVLEWGITQGMHVTGADTPYQFFKNALALETHSISHLVMQDVLLFGGNKDHFIPLSQFYDQIQSLKNMRSLTARLFTEKEQAQNHMQLGNTELGLQTIIGWITALEQRDKQMGR